MRSQDHDLTNLEILTAQVERFTALEFDWDGQGALPIRADVAEFLQAVVIPALAGLGLNQLPGFAIIMRTDGTVGMESARSRRSLVKFPNYNKSVPGKFNRVETGKVRRINLWIPCGGTVVCTMIGGARVSGVMKPGMDPGPETTQAFRNEVAEVFAWVLAEGDEA